MLTWSPILSADGSYGDPQAYEYGPTGLLIADGTLLTEQCVGLGTDTLSFLSMRGGKILGKSSWTMTGKLVADPIMVAFGTHTLLAYTVGDLDGKRNGVGAHWMSRSTGKPVSSTMIVVPQTPAPNHPGGYGIGQPAIAAKPYSPTMLFYTTTLSGVNRIGACYLNVSPGGAVTAGAQVDIIGDDGVSVDATWLSQTRVALLQSNGKDQLGFRTYTLVNGQLVRDTGETVEDGFSALTHFRLPNVIDGAGFVRGLNTQPVVSNGKFRVLIATGNKADLGSWKITPALVPAPV
jgi:hypothetical protein